MKLFTLTLVLVLGTTIAADAFAMKVHCSDPQPDLEKQKQEYIKQLNEDVRNNRQPQQFEFKGQRVVAPNAPEQRGQEYAPKPITKGSNFHECNN